MNATCRFLVGKSLKVLRTLPDASVDLVLSSPPFLGLRSYLPDDHPDKADEIGNERTPGEFIDTLLDIVEECARVLAPHGSLCLELGDTYAGSGGAGGDYATNGLRAGQPRFRQGYVRNDHPRDPAGQGEDYGAVLGKRAPMLSLKSGTPRTSDESKRGVDAKNRGNTSRGTARSKRDNPSGWPLDKSLCLIPELLRLSLAYGFNPLTGRETDRWRVRNVVRWTRPNPPVGALGDKFRPATSDLLVACKSRTRYFDLDAVRTPLTEPGTVKQHSVAQHNPSHGWQANSGEIRQNEAGAPPLDWWAIPTQGYPGAHFATWPKALCVRPILSMCPERVCTRCGEPSRRIVEVGYVADTSGGGAATRRDAREPEGNSRGIHGGPRMAVANRTTGWTDCGHDAWRPGVVLDPFAGSGTTLAVAHGHGRSSIGMDIDARNVELARGRLGMFLDDEVVA